MKTVIVFPAYNAEKTLEKTFRGIPESPDQQFFLVDDMSTDGTYALAVRLGIPAVKHEKNTGYGGNQKTCYRAALAAGADIVVMLHPDYQYSPKLVTAMASMVASDHYDVVLGSRILGGQAMLGGMPFYKYLSNRFLTFTENLALGIKLSEYHTGFRAYRRRVLETLPLEENSDDFVFDNELLVQAVAFGFRIGEISCPTKYFDEASSINFRRSVRYGLGVLGTSAQYLLQRAGLARLRIFSPEGRRLSPGTEG